ncbi:MAG: RES family NAD+ phosphorylase [Hyphomicrobiales bacterium]|nr:RES family NAD+ phosphorylase [Hyphomicrobiales bacterium]
MPGAGRIHDRELLDALEAFEPSPYSGTAWRTSWVTRDPLLGSAAGGRWHPPGTFEALYTSLDSDGSLAEIYYHLSRAPVFSSSHMRLHRLAVRTEHTLRLDTVAILESLGIEAADFPSANLARSQEIGSAAHFLEFDSLLVPSARSAGLNLVLFLDRLDQDHALKVEDTIEINWPAWKEQAGHPPSGRRRLNPET